MATFNGTQVADSISGTNDDDIITGLAGDDTINGAGGNDTITGGADADNILGGAGDDTIIGIDSTGDQVDGDDGIDTLVADLRAGDDLSQGTGTATISGYPLIGLFDNMELVQISNASDFILTLGTDAVFAFDQAVQSDDFAASGTLDIIGATFTSGLIANTAAAVTFDEDAGVTVNGTTYVDGDSFITAGGGMVDVTWNAGTDNWEFNYTHPGDGALTVATAETAVAGERAVDEVLSVTATQDGTGEVIDIAVTLEYGFGANIDLAAAGIDSGVRVVGGANDNTLISGEGNDTLIGNGGTDTFTLNGGDNTVWAGATDDNGDTVFILGDGANTVGTGVGNDFVVIDGGGDNTFYGGDGIDTFAFDGPGGGLTGAIGDNTVWAGATDETDRIYVYVGADGDNVLGGGGGADLFEIRGDGNNTLYVGKDDAADDVNIKGDGDNIVFGGMGENGTGSNDIDIFGTGANTVYNGNGDDFVDLAATATGDNLLWGGAGDDTFTFTAGARGTIAFAAGNGVDTVEGFVFDGTTKINVTELGFADVDDVLASMSDAGDLTGDGNNDVLLFVDPGQGVVFEDMSLTDFQLATPADWLVV